MKEIVMGCLARDKVTGFEGIVVARVEYLFGCRSIGLAPRVKDGKLEDSKYFDEGRLEYIDRGILPEEVQAERPGHDGRSAPVIHR